ncbi:hypothetical protein BC628DRAFT_1420348 [Trametes gibbosa]|nr:hypothetical protein BC628DRAFT_1420348 [Trametes gibbosa]
MSDESHRTSAVVRLLLDELERVRAGNRDLRTKVQAAQEKVKISSSASVQPEPDLYALSLQKENTRLKAEVEDTRMQLEQLFGERQTRDSVVTWETPERSCPTLIEEELAQRVSRAKEKSKARKLSKEKLQETIAEVQGQMMGAEAIVELEEQLSILEMHLSNKSRGLFKPVEFLQHDWISDSIGSVPPHHHVSLSAGLVSRGAIRLPQAISDLCGSGGYVMMRPGEIVWSSLHQEKSHCIFLSSTHSYNPKSFSGKGGWEPSWNMQVPESHREVFYLKAGNWYYAGTFQYQDQVVLPSSKIKTFATHSHVNDLRQRSLLFPDLVAPVLGTLIREMYDRDILKIACTGWRYVSFNRALADALCLGIPADHTVQEPRPAIVPVPVPAAGSKNTRKREREGSDVVSRKKHKA